MAQPIVNPELPYVGEVPSGLQPGKMIRFQGVTHPNSDRFNINLATGPNAKPRDDTALHLSVRLNQGYIARNSYKNGAWDDEQGSGKLPIGQAQSFEIILLVDPHHYKIAVNGQHFCEFPHRIPYDQVTHLLIDGDVSITLISFEGIPLAGDITSSQASAQVNAQGPQFGPPAGQYGPPPGAYGAPPPNFGGYGPPPLQQEEPSQFGGFFEQAQDILAGAIRTGAAEKLLGSILHSSGQGQQQQPQQGYAPQNAKYGIYPDLPTQETTTTTPKPDGALSDLIAGSGGTVTSGPAPSAPTGPFENLLSGLLSGKKGEQAAQGAEAPHPDALQGFLSNLLGGGGHGSDAPQAQGAPQAHPDALQGFLSNLLGGGGHNNPADVKDENSTAQKHNQDVLSGLLGNLMSSKGAVKEEAAASGDDNKALHPNVEMLSNLLQGLLSKQHNDNNKAQPVGEPLQSPFRPQQGSDEQYGQYPHPPQQEQTKGPMESLLSGILGGGGQQQQQPSSGGLGSMGGILGSLAGSLLHKPDQNQGHY